MTENKETEKYLWSYVITHMKTSAPRADMGGQLKRYVLDRIECSHYSVVRVGEDNCEMESNAFQDLQVPTLRCNLVVLSSSCYCLTKKLKVEDELCSIKGSHCLHVKNQGKKILAQ